jgi:hypothetical protein
MGSSGGGEGGGYNPWAFPSAPPTFQGLSYQERGANQGKLLPQYSYQAQQANIPTGPSQQTQYLLAQQRAGEQTQLGQAAMQAGGTAAEARAGLGMRGGYYSGARQQLANQAMANAQALQQGVRGAGQQAQLGLLGQGEAQKTALMQADVQAAQANQMARNAFLADLYASQMKGWAAGQEASAQERSGGSK